MARTELHTRKGVTQSERVYAYLKAKGKKGATNMEMMTALYITDVRKRISEINYELAPLYDTCIASKFETSKNGAVYKRYYLVPSKYEGKLEEWLNGPKCTAKGSTKPRNIRRR